MKLGSRIRALRTARGLSQETIAERLQVSRQAVAKWESGASLPSTANLLALCALFDVPPEALTAPECSSEDYVYAELTDEGALMDPVGALRLTYPNLIGMRFAAARSAEGVAEAEVRDAVLVEHVDEDLIAQARAILAHRRP